MAVYSYCRYSQQGQSNEGSSITRQQEIIAAYASSNNLTITDTFIDEGVSAFDDSKDDSNTEYSRLKGILRKGDYLLIERTTRLDRRSPIKAMHVATGLALEGITVCFCAEDKVIHAGSDVSDIVMLSINQGTANKESKDKSDFAKKGHERRLEKIARGEFTRITAPYWFSLNPTKDKYVLNEHASTVKLIFQMYLEGNGCTLIARHLNSENITTPKSGKKFTDLTVHSILRNPATYGCYHDRADYLPAVVSKDNWLRCKQLMADRKQMKTTRTTKSVNCWSGIAICGLCGSRYHSMLVSNKYRWLICYAKKSMNTCKASNIKESDSMLMFKEILLKLGSQNLVSVDVKHLIDKQSSLAGELSELKLKQSSIAQALAVTGISDTLLQAIKIVESTITTKTAEHDAITAKLKEIKDTEDSREYFLNNLDLESSQGRQAARQHLLRMKVQVAINRTDVGVHYRVIRNGVIEWEGANGMLYPRDAAQLSISEKYDSTEQFGAAKVLQKNMPDVLGSMRNSYLDELSSEEFEAYWTSFDDTEGDERERQFKSWEEWKTRNG